MEEFRHEYLMMHPYNQGRFFQKQQKDNRLLIYYYLSPGEIADIMEHIDVEDTKIYFKEMDPQFASAVFTDMPADDAVDILNELDKDMVASFLTIMRSEEHTSELQSRGHLVCRLLLEKK